MKLTGKRVILKGLLIMSAVFFMAACSSPDDTNTNGGDKVLSGTVTITGTAKVGQTLTADTFALNGDGTITYRWLRNDEPISGATGSTYLLDQDDHGKMIKVEVKRSGYDGVVTSAPKGPVAGTNDPDLTGTVSITGTAQVGYIFTANISALDGDGTPSYQWYRGDTAISNATGSTYTLVEADKDKLIKVEVGRSGYAGTKFSEARGPVTGSGGTPLVYEKEYWGEWIRMDNGQAYYFNSSHLTVNNQSYTLSSSALTKESDKVIAVNEGSSRYWLYASRPATSTFTGRIADMRLTTNRAARSIGGFDKILIDIGNEIKREIEIGYNGEFEVPEIVVEEDYEISFPEAPEIPPVIVTPNYNGDDIGTLNIVEGVNFKISVKAENSYNTDMTRLYANSTPYNIVIDIDNTGTENCTGANFQLDFGDLNFSPSSYDRILGTIVPGAKKSLSFTVNCPTYIDQLAYKDKVIGINIKDVNNRSWDDSVQLQFHKAPVQFNIRSDKQVQGVIISPRQKAYHFSSDAASGYSTDVTLPWTTEPYLVVFSGATLESETRYSFGINVIPDTNFIDFYQTGLHEPNNTEEQAYVIDARTEPKVMSFLHLNDIDYFLVNLDPDATPVYIAIDNTDGVYTVSGDNNGDGGANPGENFTLNLKVRNIGVKDTSGVSARLSKASNSGNSSHLSINYPDNVYLGALSAGGASVNAAFSMNISSACPAGVDIPLQVEFTNNDGDKWQSNFSLHIYPPSPANVQAQALSETKNLVSWNKATGATGYKIYNSIGEVIETVNDGNTLSYEHSGLSAGTVYRYRVSTLAAGDESVKTAEVSARTWERLIFNKQHGGMVSAGIPHYYRFYVTNSTSYRFSSNVSTYVKYESNNDNWFNLLSWDEPTMTASQSGWAYINFENAGDYSLRIMSGESTVGNFVFTNPTSTGTVISEADKTVTVRVPFGTNLTSLTPSVTAASGWTCATSGAKNFTNPVEYVFTKGDATQIYCVTVIPNGDGEIEINPPPITDIDIPGFPTTSFSLSRSEAGGIITSKDITLTGTGYTSIQWWVGEKDKTLSATNGRMTFTVNASEYTLGQHTLTVIVFKEGVPYSSEVDFNVVQ